jgi:hypothetical protein
MQRTGAAANCEEENLQNNDSRSLANASKVNRNNFTNAANEQNEKPVF